MKVIARQDDGTEVDVTEGVQVLYDHVIGSMDWGSGFLDNEEVARIRDIAITCGFKDWEVAQQSLDNDAQLREESRYRQQELGGMWPDNEARDAHGAGDEHTWSSVDQCLFPTCDALNRDEGSRYA